MDRDDVAGVCVALACIVLLGGLLWYAGWERPRQSELLCEAWSDAGRVAHAAAGTCYVLSDVGWVQAPGDPSKAGGDTSPRGHE